jgi:hypothetical protein
MSLRWGKRVPRRLLQETPLAALQVRAHLHPLRHLVQVEPHLIYLTPLQPFGGLNVCFVLAKQWCRPLLWLCFVASASLPCSSTELWAMSRKFQSCSQERLQRQLQPMQRPRQVQAKVLRVSAANLLVPMGPQPPLPLPIHLPPPPSPPPPLPREHPSRTTPTAHPWQMHLSRHRQLALGRSRRIVTKGNSLLLSGIIFAPVQPLPRAHLLGLTPPGSASHSTLLAINPSSATHEEENLTTPAVPSPFLHHLLQLHRTLYRH